MGDLHFTSHWQHYQTLLGVSKASSRETITYALRQAQQSHALAVFDPLRDWFHKAIALSDKLTEPHARSFMKYGAGRRLSMTFHAYRNITMIADATRTEPLSHDEQQELSRDLNVLYMHTRGILDNFAWSLLHQRHPEVAVSINPNHVGLFSPNYRVKCACFAEIEADIDSHKAWSVDLKERRDPVAHRIPLYIPPSQITEDEAKGYQLLWDEWLAQSAQLKFDEAEKTQSRLEKMGRFVPYFLHNPNERPIPIYPTVPEDMAHLMEVGDIVERALLRQ